MYFRIHIFLIGVCSIGCPSPRIFASYSLRVKLTINIGMSLLLIAAVQLGTVCNYMHIIPQLEMEVAESSPLETDSEPEESKVKEIESVLYTEALDGTLMLCPDDQLAATPHRSMLLKGESEAVYCPPEC
jgi:hypothetical protein